MMFDRTAGVISASMEDDIAYMLSISNLLAHSLRVLCVARAVIEEIPENILTRKEALDVLVAAMFHDIGKSTWTYDWFVKSKDQISSREWRTINQHPIVSYQLLKRTGFSCPEVLELVKNHHERPNGTGYPNRIEAGLTVTVLAASDCYAACTEPRLYRKKPLSKTEALNEIAGFSPLVVIEAFQEAIYKGTI